MENQPTPPQFQFGMLPQQQQPQLVYVLPPGTQSPFPTTGSPGYVQLYPVPAMPPMSQQPIQQSPFQQPEPQIEQQQPLGGPLQADDPTDFVVTQLSLKQRMLQREYVVTYSIWFHEAWRLFCTHWPFFVLWSLVHLVLSVIPYGMSYLLIVFWTAGFFWVGNNLVRPNGGYQKPEFRDFLRGFPLFLPVIGLTIVSALAIAIGLVLLLLPGLYFCVALAFSLPLLIEYNNDGLGVFDCISISAQVVHKRFCAVTGFVILNFFVWNKRGPFLRYWLGGNNSRSSLGL